MSKSSKFNYKCNEEKIINYYFTIALGFIWRRLIVFIINGFIFTIKYIIQIVKGNENKIFVKYELFLFLKSKTTGMKMVISK